MIYDKNTSQQMLEDFFMESSSTLNLPGIIEAKVSNNISGGRFNLINLLENKLSTINMPLLEQQPIVLGNKYLTNVDLSSLKYIDYDITQIANTLPITQAPSSYTQKFLQNTCLTKLELPSLIGGWHNLPNDSGVTVNDAAADTVSLRNNFYLRDVGLGKNITTLEQNPGSEKCFNGFWFHHSYCLKFLRLYYPYVIPLDKPAKGLELSTPIGKGEGYIYVPDNLVTAYQNATNWSVFSAKIKPLSQYTTDVLLDSDTIKKSWAQIIDDCNSGNLDVATYYIGATKTIQTAKGPKKMTIIGREYDKLASDNTKTAKLTWGCTSILDFNPLPIAGILDTNIRRLYSSVGEINTYFNELFTQLEPALQAENGIKEVTKKCYGFSELNNASDDYNVNCRLWLYSAAELGITGHNYNNTPGYNYFTNKENSVLINPPQFCLGETTIKEDIPIAIRDFNSGNDNYLCTIKYTNSGISSHGMEIQPNTASAPYIVFGFCT